jgi:hypothetical protein
MGSVLVFHVCGLHSGVLEAFHVSTRIVAQRIQPGTDDERGGKSGKISCG